MTFAATMRVGSVETLVALGAFAFFALRNAGRREKYTGLQASVSVELEIVERGRSRRVEGNCPLVVGRATEADLLLMDPEVSRHHACFQNDGKTVFVTDLQSSNGVYVNGEQIRESKVLKPGDKIDMGATRIVLLGSKVATDH
ncbi:MAG: hypothetical protein NVS9B12_11700 [Vulcanimicrobiaceae bacterium]